MKFWRLVRSLWRSIPRTYTLWRMGELQIAGKDCYNCVTCGMGMSEPCEHWLDAGPGLYRAEQNEKNEHEHVCALCGKSYGCRLEENDWFGRHKLPPICVKCENRLQPQ